MPPPYDLFTHRHRFAAWCAARAAQRGFKGGTNALLAEVFESQTALFSARHCGGSVHLMGFRP